MKDMKDLVDRGEPCRKCNGTGVLHEEDRSRNVTVADDCDRCRGTGYKTVLVLPNKGKGKANE